MTKEMKWTIARKRKRVSKVDNCDLIGEWKWIEDVFVRKK